MQHVGLEAWQRQGATSCRNEVLIVSSSAEVRGEPPPSNIRMQLAALRAAADTDRWADNVSRPDYSSQGNSCETTDP